MGSSSPSPATLNAHRWDTGARIVAALAIAKLAGQLLLAGRYGYFGDEFYYAACGEHLAWGYIDHPPLVAGLMYLTRHLLGDSLIAIRFVPALAGALVVWLAGRMARELGGGVYAQALAAVAVIAAPIYLFFFHVFSMNAVEVVLWTACCYVCVRAIRSENPKYWVLLGALGGLGLENKYSTAIFLCGLVLGLALSPARKAFATAEFWLGMCVGFFVFLPNLLWEINHQFPFLEWQRSLARNRFYVHVPPWTFLWQQVVLTGATSLLWLASLWFFFREEEGKRYRFAGVALVVVIAVFMVMKGKAFYPVPMYATAFAGGAVMVERWTVKQKLARWAIAGVVVLVGAVLAPAFAPLLPLNEVSRYEAALHLPTPVHTEWYAVGKPLPEYFAFETGWEEIVADVAEVYRGLPQEERERAGILAFNYATAGAIDYLGPKYGLPKSIGTHMNYHVWGPRDYNSDVLIVVGNTIEPNMCDRFVRGPVAENPYQFPEVAMSGPIVNVCYGLRFDLQSNWAKIPWY